MEAKRHFNPSIKEIGNIINEKGNDEAMSAIRGYQNNSFGDQMISEVGQKDECSIVSHISVEQIGKSRFDKWDVLYEDDE